MPDVYMHMYVYIYVYTYVCVAIGHLTLRVQHFYFRHRMCCCSSAGSSASTLQGIRALKFPDRGMMFLTIWVLSIARLRTLCSNWSYCVFALTQTGLRIPKVSSWLKQWYILLLIPKLRHTPVFYIELALAVRTRPSFRRGALAANIHQQLFEALRYPRGYC